MGIRRLKLVVLASLCASLGALSWDAAAWGVVTHRYLSQFNEVPANLGGPLSLAGSSMTVDSGHVWISEPSRVDEFDASTGTFISQLAHSEGSVSYSESGIAVGHTAGEARVYVGETSESPETAVAVFDEAGDLKATWTGAATPEGSFGAPIRDVAVDNSTSPLDEDKGYVYVSVPERRLIYVFRPEADGGEHYVGQIEGVSPGEPFQFPFKIAVNDVNGDLVVENGGTFDILEPQALGAYALVNTITGTPSGPLRETFNLAIDGADGEIYLTEGFEPIVVDQFSSTGAYLGKFAGADTPGGDIRDVYSLAVDPASHKVYVGDNRGDGEHPTAVDVFGPDIVIPDVATGPVSNLAPTSATLTGTVNPDEAGAATCQFAWGASTAELGRTAPCSAPEIPDGKSPVAVQAPLGEQTNSALQPDTTYYYRLQASNANGTNLGEASQDQHFTTPGPGMHGESVANVAATSATLHAKIDPNRTTATYYFQYGTTSGYGSDAPALTESAPAGLSIGGEGDNDVVQHLQNLQAATVYHYRVVVVSELAPGVLYTFDGEDETFTTQRAGSELVLPDGRQWELVSPSEKLGANVEPIGELGLAQASVNGDAMTYGTSSPTESESQGYTNGRSQVLSVRTADGWISQDLDLSHPQATGSSVGNGNEYRFFSEDDSLGVVQPFGTFDPTLSPEASEQTPFLRTDYLNGNVDGLCSPDTMHCYRPLVTSTPGYANVPPGTIFGRGLNKAYEEVECNLEVEAELICGPKFVGATRDARHLLIESRVGLTPGGGAGLYEWGAGKLTPVPGAGQMPERHGISDDGSRVILSTGSELTMSDVEKGEVVQLDAAQGGTESGGGEYGTASADGSRVFFTDSRRLTADAHTEGRDLYECKMVDVANRLTCVLSDLTPHGASRGIAGVSSTVGASEDGSYLYFAADGLLAEGAVPGTCGAGGIAERESVVCNLYVLHDGTTKLVAVLSGADSPDWHHDLTHRTARVSPDGRWLTFMSQKDLTGYVTSDAARGRPDEEVYLYDAGSGALVCASCDPTGARPVGVPYQKIEDGLRSHFFSSDGVMV